MDPELAQMRAFMEANPDPELEKMRAFMAANPDPGQQPHEPALPEVTPPPKATGRGEGIRLKLARQAELDAMPSEQRAQVQTPFENLTRGAIARGKDLAFNIGNKAWVGQPFAENRERVKEEFGAEMDTKAGMAGGILLEELATLPISAIGHFIRMPRYAAVLARSKAGQRLSKAAESLETAMAKAADIEKFKRGRTPELKKIMAVEAKKNLKRRKDELKAAKEAFDKDVKALKKHVKDNSPNDAKSIGERLMGDGKGKPGYLDKRKEIENHLKNIGKEPEFPIQDKHNQMNFGENFADAIDRENPLAHAVEKSRSKVGQANARVDTSTILNDYKGLPPKGADVANKVPGQTAAKARAELKRMDISDATSKRLLTKAVEEHAAAELAKKSTKVSKAANLASSGVARGALEGAATGFLFGEDAGDVAAGAGMGGMIGLLPDAARVSNAVKHGTVKSVGKAKHGMLSAIGRAKVNRTTNRVLGHDGLTNRIPYSVTDQAIDRAAPKLTNLLRKARDATDPTNPRLKTASEIVNFAKNSLLREVLQEEDEELTEE